MTWNKNSVKKEITKRAMAGILSVALLFGLSPAVAPAAKAASWMDPYVETAVDWGIMKGDENGNLNPEKELTRAEFVAMMNRAFGYTEVGPAPFVDVPQDAWYAEDIAIAYNAGYFKGTSAATAEPNSKLTREQTAVLIGRNLRLQGGTGENMTFIDNREISTWSRGLVEEAAKLGIIQGDDTGAFLPKDNVLRGQVACMLVRALGTLINDPGEQKLNSVYGNLTINTSGVTLKDTVVTGNLYLTGGVGLGDVELENVTVYGKIVVAGSGESTGGGHSVVLRNVDAQALEVDSISNQFLTVSAEGLTNIADTTVRTSAYLQDLTRDGLGLKNIELNGAAGTQFQLAGNIKELVNKTPGALVNFGQGVAHTVTVDEKAIGSILNIDGAANLKELNLDVGTEVTGSGDVDHLNVNAAGSSAVMLPDTITIRPGLTADIYEEEMDATAAAESSEDPRILTGYPEARKIAARSAEVFFGTNKKGTLYWGLTALADGSLSEAELVNPATVPAKILKSGTIEVKASNTEEVAKLSGLTKDGSYYVSAVLVDNRGMRSPVKVEAFTTPDDTTPAFTSGYPKALVAQDEEENQIIQAQVMVNKDCLLYYALMPQGATAPSVADFKAGALSGNLGHGVEELKKNTPWLVSQVNTSHLKEQTTYDLYLWLTDADGAKSSAIKKLSITTPDKTPPIIQHMTVTAIAAKSVTLTYAANEPGTLYWAVVKEGADFYKADSAGHVPDQEEDTAKIQIMNGIGAVKFGKSNASKALTDVKFNVSGLEAESSYDLYYVFVDKAGNYSEYINSSIEHPMTINTLDEVAPTVKQEFSRPGSSDNSKPTPYPDTSIRLIFSENVQGIRETAPGVIEKNKFLDLYENAVKGTISKDAMAKILAEHIRLYWVSDEGAVLGGVRDAANESNGDLDWLIDYRNTVIEIDGDTGELIMTFPYSETSEDSALNLASGGTYYFELEGIADTSSSENLMIGTRGVTQLPEFTTVFATVNLAIGNTVELLDDGNKIRIDMSFTATPISTEKVADGTKWDLLLWTDTIMDYTVYSRVWDEDWDDSWEKLGTVSANVTDAPEGKLYTGMTRFIQNKEKYDDLQSFNKKREYAIHVDSIESVTDHTAWNKKVTMGVTVIAGSNNAVRQAGEIKNGYTTDLETAKKEGAVSIGVKDPFNVLIPFTDSQAPEIKSLQITPGDIGATMNVMIDRPGTVYYLVAPLTEVTGGYQSPVETVDAISGNFPSLDYENDAYAVPQPVKDPVAQKEMVELEKPYVTTVTKGAAGSPGVLSGNTKQINGDITKSIVLTDLTPKTTYLVYMVTKGVSAVYSEKTLCAQFTTLEAELPIIEVTRNSTVSAEIKVNKSSDVSYALVRSNSLTSASSSFSAEFSAAKGTATDKWATDGGSYLSEVDTVLDAMLTGYYEDNIYKGSVFDKFATKSAKDTYAALIRQTATESIMSAVMMQDGERFTVPNGKDNVTKNITMTGMTGQNWYTLLVTGRTINSSGYAFCASQSYYNEDKDPLTATVTVSASTDDLTAAQKTCSGKLIVDFSDTLRYRVQDEDKRTEVYYALDYCNVGHPNHVMTDNIASDNNCKNIGSLVKVSEVGSLPTKSIKLNTTGVNNLHGTQVGDTLVFDLKNVAANSTVLIGQNICGSNGVVRENDSLTITLRYDAATDTWSAEVTPDSWAP